MSPHLLRGIFSLSGEEWGDMHIYKILFATLLTLLVSVSTSPAEASDKHLEAYRNYKAALEMGDNEAVKLYAREAWRAAEKELGDHQTTAILAYNYANWVYGIDPEIAIEPLKRVIAIAGEDNDLFGADLPIIMLRYCEANIALDDDKSAHNILRKLMESKRKEGLPFSIVAARAWRELAFHEIDQERFDRAERYAQRAERHIQEAAPDQLQVVISILYANGLALVAGGKRSKQDVEDAYWYFNRAVGLFPPQKDIETLNPLLAKVLAWRSATVVAGRSDAYMKNTRSPKIQESDTLKYANIVWQTPKPENDVCELSWEERIPPGYPKKELRKGTVGAVLLGYNITDNGLVKDARILAEVPGKTGFGEEALASTKEWRLEKSTPPECRQNLVAHISYMIGAF